MGITKFYTDGLKTYERHIPEAIRQVSKYKMWRGSNLGNTLGRVPKP